LFEERAEPSYGRAPTQLEPTLESSLESERETSRVSRESKWAAIDGSRESRWEAITACHESERKTVTGFRYSRPERESKREMIAGSRESQRETVNAVPQAHDDDATDPMTMPFPVLEGRLEAAEVFEAFEPKTTPFDTQPMAEAVDAPPRVFPRGTELQVVVAPT